MGAIALCFAIIMLGLVVNVGMERSRQEQETQILELAKETMYVRQYEPFGHNGYKLTCGYVKDMTERPHWESDT